MNNVEISKQKDGHHRIKFPNGKIRIEYTTKKGVLEGPYKTFHENGQLKSECFHLNGEMAGRFRWWESDGMLYGQRFYLANRLITKKRYEEECKKNPKLPRYKDEKVSNTFGSYVRRLKREKRQKAKLGLSPDQIQSNKWFDQECQLEVKKKTSMEALAWLGKKGGARELGNLTRKAALAFVRRLYDSVAIKVWASNIERDPDGCQYSKRLIVELPREVIKRGEIYKECIDSARPGSDGRPAIRIGHAYMAVSLL